MSTTGPGSLVCLKECMVLVYIDNEGGCVSTK